MKRTITAVLLTLLILPLSAQERTDTTYTFRFVTGKDMFYIPYGGNDKELARLESCVGQYRTDILAGDIPLYVDGYCASAPTEAENLALAKIRSNRVKSELITRQALTETCFVTKNHAGGGDYVTVRISVPIYNEVEETAAPAEDTLEQKEAVVVKEEPQETTEVAQQPTATETAQSLPKQEKATDGYRFALRANLLRWATLTPDLGLEWRINRNVGIAVNGSWTLWSWDDKNRRYALWEVAPELRWYLGKERRGYIGAMYKVGEFNYKFSHLGKQGDLMGGGLTGGYQLRLNDALSMDFSLGIGYIHADCEKYEVIDGVRVRRGEKSKNWWGPINAGVTLVWKLF